MVDLDQAVRRAALERTTSGNSGATKIGVSGISGLVGGAATQVQAALSGLKGLIDNNTAAIAGLTPRALPSGGASGDALVKTSGSDYASGWAQRYVNTSLLVGLNLTWDSATTLGVEIGAAYIPSLGRVLEVPTRLTTTFSGLTANTLYYVYLTSTGSLLVSSALPSSPFFGDARTMTGDTSKRYIGEVLALSATTIYEFIYLPSMRLVRYVTAQDAAPFGVLSDGRATNRTIINLGAVVPPTTRLALINAANRNAATFLRVGFPGAGTDLGNADAAIWRVFSQASSSGGSAVNWEALAPTDATQRIDYRHASDPGAGLGSLMSVRGYGVRR